jgi:methionine biosynthesis protein MetW
VKERGVSWRFTTSGVPAKAISLSRSRRPNYAAVSKYSAQGVPVEDRNSATTKIVGLVPTGARVLDVGCSAGYLGEALKERRQARVWGIELDETDAAKARKRGYEEVIAADLDLFNWEDLGRNEFDVVVFADVLEHLKRPGDAIRGAAKRLAPDGMVIASIPNIAHLSIRVELMEGGFAYEKLGLLDDTHLKYFTKKTIEDLFTSAGLSIRHLEATVYDLPEDRVAERLRAVGLETTPRFWETMNADEARAYQYVVVAGRGPTAAAMPIELPEKAVMEHARLVSELKSSAAEVAHLRDRINRIERMPTYRIEKAARGALRSLRRR